MKKCTKCGIEKELDEFHKQKSAKDGHRFDCKSCAAKSKAKWYAENKEKITKSKAKWYAENKEKRIDYLVEHKEKITKSKAKWYAENKEEIAKSNAENKEERAKYRAEKKAEQPNCVYRIRNLENNKAYIGETIRGELRWKRHLRDLRGNRHPNKLLQEDFDKYGEQAFEWSIMKEFEDEDKSVLLLEEARTIQQFIAEGAELYNLMLTIDQLRMLTENK